MNRLATKGFIPKIVDSGTNYGKLRILQDTIFIRRKRQQMDELISLLDENLRYISHEIENGSILIQAESVRTEAVCPFCGTASAKVHSRYSRKLQDLPIQGKKVRIHLENKKYFCINADCNHTTFAEQFDFYDFKATKTKRLQEEILRVALTQSSVSASKYLRNSVAEVSKSVICDLLKKEREKS